MTNSNEYMRAYLKKRHHERHRLARDLLGGKCVQCGATTGLEIDHIDPKTKSMGFTAMARATMNKFLAELQKCQLLCDEHHNLKTMAQKGLQPAKGTHGTVSAYRYCKCEKCRAAHNAHHNKWRHETGRRGVA